MKKYSLSALAAAGLSAGGLATSANAADLGGNCCADLEERVAELEATTARKGNRKVQPDDLRLGRRAGDVAGTTASRATPMSVASARRSAPTSSSPVRRRSSPAGRLAT